MQRPRRRDRVPLPLFDVAGSPTAPPRILDLDETHRLHCIRYGVVPTGQGLLAPPTRYPLRCAWPVSCAFVQECGCVLTAPLRDQLRRESIP
jgi:hypothetical protein